MWYASLVIPKYIVPPHLSLVATLENSASALQTLWHPGYDEKNLIYGPLLTRPTYVYNLFRFLRGQKIYKKCTSNGGENWGLSLQTLL